jgi:hypothetical protein
VPVLQAFTARGGALVLSSNAPSFYDDTNWLGFTLSPRVVFGDGPAPYDTTHQATSPSRSVTVRSSHPVLSGPFGTVTTFQNWHTVAGFAAVPASATVLARTTLTGPDGNGSSNFITITDVATLAVIPAGASGPGSGPIVVTSDVDTFSNAYLVDGYPTDTACTLVGTSNGTLARNTFAWIAAQLAPETPASLLTSVASLPLESQVGRLYVAFFGRAPDAGGLAYHVDRRRNGTSAHEVADAFAGSPEFTARYGTPDDASFVSLVYATVFGRAPDPEGAAYWKVLLAAGVVSRGGVMAGFADSPEFVALTATAAPQTSGQGEVARLYLATLARPAEATGYTYWSGLIDNGTASVATVAAAFVLSPEFTTRYAGLDDAAFVAQVYLQVFARPGDSAGLAYWTALVPVIGRAGVMVGFANSAEYVAATHTFPITG